MGRVRKPGSLKPTSSIARASLKILALFLLLGIAGDAVFYYGPVYGLTTYAPEQPIPYSHKQHAGDLKIPCLYCHAYARRSEIAGIPSLSKCNNCHSNLSVESDAIDNLKKHIEEEKPIEWVRVFETPDHVWFNHKRHILRNIACQECHGPIETMKVTSRLVLHHMGFCLQCHQENGAPTDCITCHT